MRKNRTKKLTLSLILLMVVFGTYFVAKKSTKQNQSGQVSGNSGFGESRETEVVVYTVKNDQIQEFQELPGRVSAVKISEIRPQADGIIKKQTFVEGSFVKKGKQLYQIDSTIYKASYENAKANLKTISAKQARYKKLLALEGVSKQEYDDIEAALIQAKADFKKAKANLNYTKVIAPISGYIGKSNFTEGALVNANQTQVLTTIVQLDPIYVDMTQSTKEAMILRRNNKGFIVSLTVNENSDEKLDLPLNKDFDSNSTDNNQSNGQKKLASEQSQQTTEIYGKLESSENFADENTDSVRLRALFPNKNHLLIPGMFVEAKIHLKKLEKITVPQKATTRMPNGDLMVWVVGSENIVKPRVIKANKTLKDNWIVEEGLEDGENIVLEGILKINDGAKVKPINTTNADL